MGVLFKNFATSTIANVGGITAVATSLDVQAGEGALFPLPVVAGVDFFYIVCVKTTGEREIMKVTNRSTDTFAVTRAQDGTTALAFDENDKVELRVTAAALEDIAAEAVDIESGTVMLFGQNAAPTGWTRKADWQDNAMLCYAAAGNINNGGAVNPQSTHTHTGPSHSHTVANHTHTVAAHTHTGPSHAHTTGSHALSVAEMPSHAHTYLSPSDAVGGVANISPSGGTWNLSYSKSTSSQGSGSAHSHGNTGASGTGNTGSSGSGNTGSAGSGSTGTEGTGVTGANGVPFYQEVIAATRD